MKILISSCLLGKNVKYSGSNNFSTDLVELLKKYKVEIIEICPEVLGDLTIPREPAEITSFSKRQVINKLGIDVSAEFINGAEKTLKIALDNKVNFAILKEKSPSCGSKFIYDGTFSGKLVKGRGITAELLLKNNIKVFSELDLEEIEKEIEKI